MRRIALVTLVMEGFKCFRNKTTMTPSPDGGFYFLTGQNGPEPRLGANGAGKSSLWDALCWCWYGSSVRGNKAADIVSWGVKRPHVAVLFRVGDTEHRVERWGSPDRITINGNLAAQSDVDTLIGISRQRFLHSVIFGQAAPLFLDLSIPQRGDLLDEVLDLGLWMRLSKRASAHVVTMGTTIAQHQKNLAFNEGVLRGLADDQVMQAQADAWTNQHDADLEALSSKLEAVEAEVLALDARVAECKALRDGHQKAYEACHSQLQLGESAGKADAVALARVQDKAGRDRASLEFYTKHQNCPTCQQPLEAAFVDTQVRGLKRDLAGAQVDIDALTGRIHQREQDRAEANAARDAILGSLRAAQFDLTEAETTRDMHKRRLADGARELGALLAAVKNPFSEALAQARAKRAGVVAAMRASTLAAADLSVEMDRTKFWCEGFKRVRLAQVKRALSMLELETANAASSLGLPGWRINYVTEVDNKSGGTRAGVRVLVTSPTVSAPWEVWSGGEGQRIRLAVQLGIAALVQRMSGTSFGFEVWDEPSNWLSPEGIDDLLECLRWRADATGRAVWLLDHRALSFGGFDEVWLADKTSEGTTIELIQENTR